MTDNKPVFTLKKERYALEIDRDGEIVAKIMFVKLGGTIIIQYMRNTSFRTKTLQEFVEKFGVPPGKYLIEELIRGGAKRFLAGALSRDGRRLRDAAEKKALIKRNRILSMIGLEKGKVTPKWASLARTRKKLIH